MEIRIAAPDSCEGVPLMFVSELKFAEGVGGVGGFDVASCLPGGEELAWVGTHASAQTELDEMLACEELGEFYEQVAGASADADDVVLLAGCEEVVAEELAWGCV